jgi:hypothetical protein
LSERPIHLAVRSFAVIIRRIIPGEQTMLHGLCWARVIERGSD